jgi:type II secretory pathway pseudopilin PulG
MKSNMSPSKNCVGFSLVEMAVVLVILGFVLATLLLPLQAQREQLFRSQTENTLEIARKALLGFAQSQGRLPCPATANGIENPTGGGACASAVGFLPAATLGIQPTDANGFAIDGWNNPIRYAVTTVNTAGGAATPDFTTSGEISVVGIANLAPDLRVCADSAVANCSATEYLVNNAVAVVFSTGPTVAAGSGGADEDENLDGDTVFVSQAPIVTAGNEFDHLVVWLSPYVLYNAMVETGQLH